MEVIGVIIPGLAAYAAVTMELIEVSFYSLLHLPPKN